MSNFEDVELMEMRGEHSAEVAISPSEAADSYSVLLLASALFRGAYPGEYGSVSSNGPGVMDISDLFGDSNLITGGDWGIETGTEA
jgi:hypothetical protein